MHLVDWLITSRREDQMKAADSTMKGYVIAALLGAVGGGVIVAVATRAIPKITAGMAQGMMQRMMVQMKAGGCCEPGKT
jgi:hypothetical protein